MSESAGDNSWGSGGGGRRVQGIEENVRFIWENSGCNFRSQELQVLHIVCLNLESPS